MQSTWFILQQEHKQVCTGMQDDSIKRLGLDTFRKLDYPSCVREETKQIHHWLVVPYICYAVIMPLLKSQATETIENHWNNSLLFSKCILHRYLYRSSIAGVAYCIVCMHVCGYVNVCMFASPTCLVSVV